MQNYCVFRPTPTSCLGEVVRNTVSAIAVARVEDPTPETFFRDYVYTRTPVVLCNTRARDSLGSWDPEWVAALLEGREFQFKRSTTNAHPNFRATTVGEMFSRNKMTFRQFFEMMTQGSEAQRSHYIFTGDEHYVARQRNGVWSVNPELQPLWEVVTVPEFVPREQVYSVWAWFSGQGVHTWLHYDNNGCHNLNVQLHGEKRCVLFAPESSGMLDLFEPGQPVPAYNCSRIDLDSASGAATLERVPHFEATIQAGDLLYIPPHWLHAFWHRGAYNANINFWWKPRPQEMPAVDDNDVARREARFATHEATRR